MTFFLQQLVQGLALGSIYGLIAIGYVLIYNTIVVLDEITPSAPKRELPAQLPLTRQRMGTAF